MAGVNDPSDFLVEVRAVVPYLGLTNDEASALLRAGGLGVTRRLRDGRLMMYASQAERLERKYQRRVRREECADWLTLPRVAEAFGVADVPALLAWPVRPFFVGVRTVVTKDGATLANPGDVLARVRSYRSVRPASPHRAPRSTPS